MTIELYEFAQELLNNGYGDIANYLLISNEFDTHLKLSLETNEYYDLIDNNMTTIYMNCGYGLGITSLLNIRNLNDYDYWGEPIQIMMLDLITEKIFRRMKFRYLPDYLPFDVLD